VVHRLPTAYLVQEAWLGEFRFYVDQRVIVPRSYFAELLETGFAPWIQDPEAVESALDLCTGSGCLAILMAHAFPNAAVDAIDISADALVVASRNIADYRLDDRINLVRSDLFGNLPDKSYDLIISNPPYVTAMAMEELPPEYRHEPELALAGGDDGLEAVRAIVREAPRFLAPRGVLVVEVGHNRAAVELAWPRTPFVWLETETAADSVFLLTRETRRGALSEGVRRAAAPSAQLEERADLAHQLPARVSACRNAPAPSACSVARRAPAARRGPRQFVDELGRGALRRSCACPADSTARRRPLRPSRRGAPSSAPSRRNRTAPGSAGRTCVLSAASRRTPHLAA
jgi:ribosomal protein L3 glutamine methyltransferase